MLKKISLLSVLPLLSLIISGCSTPATFTNLTPRQQAVTPNNLYPVEVAFNSRQQSLRWDSIKPQIVVGDQTYPMRPTPLMSNRWEGLIPVPAGTGAVHYQYKFDYLNNAFGPPQPDSARSAEYTLKIVPATE